MPRIKRSERPTFQINLTHQELDKLHFIADSRGEPMTEVFRSFVSKEYRKISKKRKARSSK